MNEGSSKSLRVVFIRSVSFRVSSFIRLWLFNGPRSWLTSGGSEIQTGAQVLHFPVASPDKSIVHMQAHPGMVSDSAFISPHRGPCLTRRCSPGGLVMVVIVHRDSRRLENKTGRSGLRSSSWGRNADNCTSRKRQTGGTDAVVIFLTV